MSDLNRQENFTSLQASNEISQEWNNNGASHAEPISQKPAVTEHRSRSRTRKIRPHKSKHRNSLQSRGSPSAAYTVSTDQPSTDIMLTNGCQMSLADTAGPQQTYIPETYPTVFMGQPSAAAELSPAHLQNFHLSCPSNSTPITGHCASQMVNSYDIIERPGNQPPLEPIACDYKHEETPPMWDIVSSEKYLPAQENRSIIVTEQPCDTQYYAAPMIVGNNLIQQGLDVPNATFIPTGSLPPPPLRLNSTSPPAERRTACVAPMHGGTIQMHQHPNWPPTSMNFLRPPLLPQRSCSADAGGQDASFAPMHRGNMPMQHYQNWAPTSTSFPPSSQRTLAVGHGANFEPMGRGTMPMQHCQNWLPPNMSFLPRPPLRQRSPSPPTGRRAVSLAPMGRGNIPMEHYSNWAPPSMNFLPPPLLRQKSASPPARWLTSMHGEPIHLHQHSNQGPIGSQYQPPPPLRLKSPSPPAVRRSASMVTMREHNIHMQQQPKWAPIGFQYQPPPSLPPIGVRDAPANRYNRPMQHPPNWLPTGSNYQLPIPWLQRQPRSTSPSTQITTNSKHQQPLARNASPEIICESVVATGDVSKYIGDTLQNRSLGAHFAMYESPKKGRRSPSPPTGQSCAAFEPSKISPLSSNIDDKEKTADSLIDQPNSQKPKSKADARFSRMPKHTATNRRRMYSPGNMRKQPYTKQLPFKWRRGRPKKRNFTYIDLDRPVSPKPSLQYGQNIKNSPTYSVYLNQRTPTKRAGKSTISEEKKVETLPQPDEEEQPARKKHKSNGKENEKQAKEENRKKATVISKLKADEATYDTQLETAMVSNPKGSNPNSCTQTPTKSPATNLKMVSGSILQNEQIASTPSSPHSTPVQPIKSAAIKTLFSGGAIKKIKSMSALPQQTPETSGKNLFGGTLKSASANPSPTSSVASSVETSLQLVKRKYSKYFPDSDDSASEKDSINQVEKAHLNEDAEFKVTLPKVNFDMNNNNTKYMKIPAFVPINAESFDPDTYQDTTTAADGKNKASREKFVRKTKTTIRHRTVKNRTTGETQYQSNSYFVRWDDDSETLHVGSTVFDVVHQPMADNRNYMYLRTGSIFQPQFQLNRKTTLQPMLETEFGQCYAQAKRPQGQKTAHRTCTKVIMDSVPNPNLDRHRKIKEEMAKLRSAAKKPPVKLHKRTAKPQSAQDSDDADNIDAISVNCMESAKSIASLSGSDDGSDADAVSNTSSEVGTKSITDTKTDGDHRIKEDMIKPRVAEKKMKIKLHQRKAKRLLSDDSDDANNQNVIESEKPRHEMNIGSLSESDEKSDKDTVSSTNSEGSAKVIMDKGTNPTMDDICKSEEEMIKLLATNVQQLKAGPLPSEDSNGVNNKNVISVSAPLLAFDVESEAETDSTTSSESEDGSSSEAESGSVAKNGLVAGSKAESEDGSVDGSDSESDSDSDTDSNTSGSSSKSESESEEENNNNEKTGKAKNEETFNIVNREACDNARQDAEADEEVQRKPYAYTPQPWEGRTLNLSDSDSESD